MSRPAGPPTTFADRPRRVGELFDAALAAMPDAEALVTRGGRWSYRELDDACARATAALAALGVSPGDRVAASLPNEIDIVVAFHAAMRLGAVWVGINQALAPPEQAYLLTDSEAGVLLCTDDAPGALAAHRGDLPDLERIVPLSEWAAAWTRSDERRDLPDVDPSAPAGLAYTSGTTGRPKGAVHSQLNLLTPGAVLVRDRGWGPDLRKGDCFPLTILNLMVLTTLLTPQAGGTCILMDQMYAEGVADWVQRESVTVWNGPPPILHSMCTSDEIPTGALATLREVWSGGAELPEVLRSRFRDTFGVPVIGTYGLSEAPTVVSIDPPDGSFAPRASGRPLPHLAVHIEGVDGPLPAGELGEVCFTASAEGPFAEAYRPPLGYWHRPEASDELLAGGIVHTGDIGFLDDDGWLHIRDRKNLVIIRGGANVYPAEVERVLVGIDGVAGAAVIGIPDERLGERVVAAVEVDAGAAVDPDALVDACRSELAKYKVPERIVVVDTLPRNAMGKVDRTAVSTSFAD